MTCFIITASVIQDVDVLNLSCSSIILIVQKKVLSALEEAGIFTFGGLVKDKVEILILKSSNSCISSKDFIITLCASLHASCEG